MFARGRSPPDDLDDLRGHFRHGYTPESASWALALLGRVTGIDLCIVWGFEDAFGFGGDSDYAIVVGGEPHVIDSGLGDMDEFLLGSRRSAPAMMEITVGRKIEVFSD